MNPDVRRLLTAAVAAPSIHNSQPWLFRVGDGHIDVYADRRRLLGAVDPLGRELFLSVGAAVLNLRVAALDQGHLPLLRLLPDAGQPDLAARVTIGPAAHPVDPTVHALAEAIPRRHTNRRPFNGVELPGEVVDELAGAAAAEGATLAVADQVGRASILALVRTANERQVGETGYRAELTEWTVPLPGRRDGVPPAAFGPWDVMETLPLRDFGLTQPELPRRQAGFEPDPTVVVLYTTGDGPVQWLRAGQALQRVLLTATVRGVASTPMSQPLEIPELRDLLAAPEYGRVAQVILRLGYAQPTGPTPRRPLSEVLLPVTAGPSGSR